jgi:hypothetical protein
MHGTQNTANCPIEHVPIHFKPSQIKKEVKVPSQIKKEVKVQHISGITVKIPQLRMGHSRY